MIRTTITLITAISEILIVWAFPFVRFPNMLIAFFCVLLLVGVVIKESREDMDKRNKAIVNGFVTGTYLAAATVSIGVLQHKIPLEL